jgi:hypothetical protein
VTEEESSELEKLILLLHYPSLKIPNDMRLYLVNENGDEYYVKNGRFSREFQDGFQYLFPNRGDILEAFARFEFIIGEIIRFSLIGFELEKKDMMIDLISSIGLNRQISFLVDWKIIDQDTKRTLNSLLEVRNGLAHKFFIEEISYKNEKLIEYGENKVFDKFKKDMNNSWKKLIKIYAKYQEKIDFKHVANRIRNANNLNLK